MTTESSQTGLPAVAGEPYALVARDLTIAFGGITAVDQVTIGVRPGECLGLIGPNGAGKTTILDCLSGLCPPTSGRVLLDGADVSRRSGTWFSRAKVRRTFQRTQAFGWLSVEENVMIPLELHGRFKYLLPEILRLPSARRRAGRMRQAADDVLRECGLTEVKDSPAAAIPIGQLRMLEFARAIIDTPRLLLLDEPTSGLGSAQSERVAEFIREVKGKRDCSIILVEHDVEFVMSLCDRIIVLSQGRVLCEGSPEEVRRDPAVIDAYIGR
ncbi:MAG TPA: ABC transporter ATP-binding protein [Streptosporangiaceae bacterium]|nr:ABC transporter ATP-binding protein [Streptosporangiaceae bacterium]